jgi:glycosyltransferase involved in cell wall biosynthesis
MRVLLIGSYPPPFGGVATYVEQLARLLREAGHECVVLTSLQPAHEYPVHVAGLASLPSSLWRLRPDVVHDVGRLTIRPAFDREEVLALLLLTGWGPRVVASLHHGGVAAQLRAGSALRRSVTRWKCSRVARLLLDTAEIQGAICAFGVPAERTTVISPHLPIALHPVPIRRSVADFLGQHGPVVGTSLWRLVPYYGLHLTLAVLQELRSTYPEIGLFVSLGTGEGDPDYTRQINATIEREGLAPHVHFNTEDVGRDEFLSIVAGFDALVRPSFVDADSLSVYEALHLGVPVVASDADRRPEGTTVFRSGDVADYRAKLSAALAAGRTGNGAGSLLARKAAENFGRILEVYEEVGRAGRQPA